MLMILAQGGCVAERMPAPKAASTSEQITADPVSFGRGDVSIHQEHSARSASTGSGGGILQSHEIDAAGLVLLARAPRGHGMPSAPLLTVSNDPDTPSATVILIGQGTE